ncbi:MAG: TonB-dependent receptor [Candidatus Acidiferrales bacterium]|jgi:hypothetical protein
MFSLMGFSAAVFAQSGTGTITGTVTDPKGLTIPAANLVIKNTDTGIDRPVATTDTGSYTATFLQPGHYQITVTKDGFATVVRKDLNLSVGQTLTVDVAMTVGTAVSEITVTGEAPIIEPDRTEVSQTVSEALASSLPLNGRRWQSFVFLTPGVAPDGASGLFTFHGVSSLYNNSQVDGVSNQQAFFSEDRGRTLVGYTYSLDAVKEFTVNSDAYSAEYGQAAGGTVSAVTKSGTNDIHGDLFYYLRYPALNSLDPYARTHGATPINGNCPTGTIMNTSILGHAECITNGEHQRQQFGGSVGGPIIKDKLFYFVNYDGQRRSFPIIYTGPSSNNSATALGSMIANNCTASNNFAAVVTIVGLTSAQCAAAVNFINMNSGPAPRNANQDIALGKIDYQVTERNHLSVSFNWMDFAGPDLYNSNPTQTTGSAFQNGKLVTHDRYLVASWNSVISSTLVNDFRFQWSRDLQAYASNFSGPSVYLGPNSTTGFFGYGEPNALPRPAFPDEHRLEFADTISKVHGNHALKAGIDISPIHDVLTNLFNGGGIYNYNYTDTTPATAAATLQAWIADLYNLPLSTDAASGALVGKHYNQFFQSTDTIHPTAPGNDDFYDTDLGFFVQDTWKFSSNITLNLGLRYDLQMVPQPYDPNKNPFAAMYTTSIYLDKSNVAPRLGIAYQPIKNLVIRAGYGLFFGKTTNSTYYNTRSENGQVQQQPECDVTYVPATGLFSSPQTPCAPVFPNVFFTAPGPTLEAPPGVPGAIVPKVVPVTINPTKVPVINIRGQDPKFLQPMVNEAEVGGEYQLPGNISAAANFVINRGAHLPVCNDVNLAPATSTVTYTITGGTFAATGQTVPGGTVTVPLYTARLNTGAVPTNFGSPFALGIVDSCESAVHSLYEAGVFTVKKAFGHGVEFLANYTVASSMDDEETTSSNATSGGTFGGNSSDVTIDPYNQNGEYARSDFYQHQRFITSFTYSPTVKIDNAILNYLANGFGFGGIVTIASPFPQTALLSSSGPFNGGIDGGATGGVSNNASNAAGRSPQYPRNFFFGPTQVRDVDFRVTRDLTLWKERYRMQLIAEAFNLFNHTIVTQINATGFNISGTTLTANSAFLTPLATSNNIAGARQMQFSAKLFF